MRWSGLKTPFLACGMLAACAAPQTGEPLELDDEGEAIEDVDGATALAATLDPAAQVPGFGLGIEAVGADLQLTWDDQGAGVTYEVWRSPTAGFVPGNTSATMVASGLTGDTTVVAGAAGGDDDFYRVRASTGADSTIAGEVNTEVFPGLNQIGISLFPMEPTSAGVEGGLADISVIQSWDPVAQQFDDWEPWSTDPPIPVEHGESVWLGVIAAQVHALWGQVPATDEVDAPLYVGWNSIVMPLHGSSMMASEVLAQLPGADSVSHWSGADQDWSRLWQAGWGADFVIEPGMGFWIYMNTPGATFDPRVCGDGLLDPGEECDDGNWADGDGCSAACEEEVLASDCAPGFDTVSVAPSGTMVLCDDPTNATCEQDLEVSCPAGWGLCTRLQHINRNDGWTEPVGFGGTIAVGEISCRTFGGAGHYSLGPYDGVNSLDDDPPLNCGYGSSRATCTATYGCNEQSVSAVCCAPTPTCGNGVVDSPEEECDDGNTDETDACLNSCAWRVPAANGVPGIGC